MTPIIYNLIFGWYRSTSGRHRPFPSDFGHLCPFYSLQNRRIFLRFVGGRRQARGERESLLPCATRTSSSPVSQVTRKRPKTDASERKRTISSWSDFLCFWLRKIPSVLRRNRLVSDTDVHFPTVHRGFRHLRPFLNGIDRFRTSVFRRFGPISKSGSVFVTIFSDFRHL